MNSRKVRPEIPFSVNRGSLIVAAWWRFVVTILVVAWTGIAGGEEPTASPPSPTDWRFLKVEHDRLLDGDRAFRFVSFNIPNLCIIEDHFDFRSTTSWRWTNEFEIHDALESVRQMGGTVVRPYVISVRREGSEAGDTAFILAPGKIKEAAFRTLDSALAIARAKGIRLIIPLVDNWHWWGGIREYAAFRELPPEAFWTDPKLLEDFRRTIELILTRRNTVTGIRYRDDPTIFGWETGNELDSPVAWTRAVAETIKSLAPRQLVIDGNSRYGIRDEALAEPLIDILTTHHYPSETAAMLEEVQAAIAATKSRKPYFVGEFGFVDTPTIKSVLEAVEQSHACGALLWSLRFHSRDGGFYVHSEPLGAGRFKAYHWPGFATGKPYDEGPVLDLMRQHAYAIRGDETPSPAPHSETAQRPTGPASNSAPPPTTLLSAPTLLPTDHSRLLNWQGVAGASHYEVQIASRADGPWKSLALSVDDTRFPYRPLFVDRVTPCGPDPIWYQILGHSGNSVSPPSSPLGPIQHGSNLLVDEFDDASQVHAQRGSCNWQSDDSRRFEEDPHRLRMAPDATVIYHVPQPIAEVRLWTLHQSPMLRVAARGSTDGRDYQRLRVSRQHLPRKPGDYNYVDRFRYVIDTGDSLPKWVALTVTSNRPTASTDGLAQDQDASTATADQPSESTMEWSRLEVEFAPGPRRSSCSLDASVILMSRSCYERAEAYVERAAAVGSKRVNFVVTLHAKLGPDRHVRELGLCEGWGEERSFEPMTTELGNWLTERLAAAFRRAVELDLEIAILPHLDDASSEGVWRNFFSFDPLEEYQGNSYRSTMIESIVTALEASVPSNHGVVFSLGGEMGRSLFAFPGQYRQIADRLRDRSRGPYLALGVSLNHNNVAGEHQPTTDQTTELQQLFDELQFLGFSNYRPVQVPPTTDDFVAHVQSFEGELRSFGLTLPDTMPIHFSETGLGGFSEQGPTDDPEKAAAVPYSGGGYFENSPWKPEVMQQLRRDYHRALLKFLHEQPAHRPVTTAFLWSTGSWDPQGIREPRAANEEISRQIREHNAR